GLGLALLASRSGPPFAAPRVTVVETAETRTVGTDAAFRFDRQTFGQYTLLVQSVNRPDAREGITYAADSQVHNVILPVSFAGAVRGLPDAQPPYLVCDIGGGSPELVLGDGASLGGGMDSAGP